MAQFTLSTINARGETILTRYDAVTGETAGLTFDESLSTSIDGNTLSFSMLKYHYEGSQKVVNTAATALIYGSQIKLLTNGQTFLFNIESIKYTFLQDNLQLDFSCIDSFQYELSKLGIGYTIEQDTTDPNYEGAQSIDYWAHKIVKETGVRWSYIAIDEANADLIRQFNSPQLIQELRDNEASLEEWTEYQIDWSAKPEFTEISFNWPVSFTCSNSTAYTALKQLGTENELVLRYNPADLTFWFVPQKNPWFKGYYFNPNNNLQAFSLSGAAQNLVTVLNVQGPKDYNDQEILLVPSFPNNVVSYIQTPAWETSVYYTNLYIDNCATEEDKDDIFYKTSAYTPWLENKLINIDYFKDSSLITQWEYNDIENILNNKLRIVNGSLIIQTAAYLQKYEEDYMAVSQKQIDTERLNANLYGDIDSIYQIMKVGLIGGENGVYPPIGIKYMQDASGPGGAGARIGVYNINNSPSLYYKKNNDGWREVPPEGTEYITVEENREIITPTDPNTETQYHIGQVTLTEIFNNGAWSFQSTPNQYNIQIPNDVVNTSFSLYRIYTNLDWRQVDQIEETESIQRYGIVANNLIFNWLSSPSDQFCVLNFKIDGTTIQVTIHDRNTIIVDKDPDGNCRSPLLMFYNNQWYFTFFSGGDSQPHTVNKRCSVSSFRRTFTKTLTDATTDPATVHNVTANVSWSE